MWLSKLNLTFSNYFSVLFFCLIYNEISSLLQMNLNRRRIPFQTLNAIATVRSSAIGQWTHLGILHIVVRKVSKDSILFPSITK